MNNEINRRDFMKLSVASIMTASVTLNLGNTAFATTASENPKDVLKNFFESFSPTDHESYFAGSSNTDGKNSGRLRQNGSNYLASTKSYTYTEILHYYYDNSSYNNPSVGIVKIN